MNLLNSLLDAIVRLEGDALVMHVGEKPYVVTTTSSVSVNRRPLAWGQVELSSRVLTPDAVLGMLSQILPLEERQALENLGAIEYHVPEQEGALERFRIIAARGGDDIWLEVRRHRPEPEAPAIAEPPAEVVAPAPQAAAPVEHLEVPPAEEVHAVEPPPTGTIEIIHDVNQAALTDEDVDALIQETARALPNAQPASSPEAGAHIVEEIPPAVATPIASIVEQPAAEAPAIEMAEIELTLDAAEPEPVEIESVFSAVPDMRAEEPPAPPVNAVPPPQALPATPPPQDAEPVPDVLVPPAAEIPTITMAQPPVAVPEPIAPAATASTTPVERETPPAEAPAVAHVPERAPSVAVPPAPEPPRVAAAPPDRAREPAETPASLQPSGVSAGPWSVERSDEAPSRPSPREVFAARDDHAPEPRPVVVPLSRRPQRDQPSVSGSFGIEDLLRTAAARGASTMYLVAQSDPMLRTEGEFSPLHIGAPLGESDIERMLLEVAPEAARDAWQRGAPAEWICDIPGIGRVRAVTFTDHRGHGLIFRMTPPLAISADQLGLPPVAQGFCSESDGLVIVAGPRASGKSTLLAAFVDLINRTRSDHVITLERQIGFVHENRRSFISQREVPVEAGAAPARAALREDPDVLVIEDVRSEDEASTVLEAADSGRLVFASMTAGSTVDAVDRFLELFAGDRRTRAQGVLATVLRGMLAQVLLRRARGGRIAAREVLLKTSTVAGLIERGQTAQLARVIESGRRHGMIPLNDALAAVVRDGTVQMTEAYRKTFDKEALLAALKRDGIDTSLVERLA